VPPYVEPPPPPPPPVDKTDTDGDGIPDDEDACMDAQGPRTNDPRTNGCGDRDEDGIVDPLDACPDVPGVASSDPKKNGCPGDRDGDGIDDPDDACPDVKGEHTDDPKTNGCPPDPDRDHDGISNASDACPDEPGPADPIPSRNGCPFAFVRNGQIILREQPQFLGVTGRLVLPASEPTLNGILAFLKEHDEIERVRVEGHTDNRGDPSGNQRLSVARAQAVVDWLVAHGMDKSKLTVVGHGADRPIDANDTDEGRAANRRIELYVETSHP
jgi:outer membrane protein OmpA-like peptidoglycan-associated protein